MSAFGLLLVLLIMGGMTIGVFAAVGGSGTTALPTLPGSSTNTAPRGEVSPAAGNAASVAAESACRTNFAAVEQAVSYYQTLNGQPPASMAALRTILRDPVSSPSYTITIDPHRPGRIDVATRGHPAAAGPANCGYA